MAKLSIEYGKIKSDGGRSVMIRIVSGKTQKHVPTNVILNKSDYKVYPDGRIRVTNNVKYFMVEDILADYTVKLNEIMRNNIGSTFTADELFNMMTRSKQGSARDIDFFEFADDYLSNIEIKGKRNYMTMLNSLQRYNMGMRRLSFSDITFSFIQGYSMSLNKKPRAQSLYLGAIRHIYRQACLVYNTDDKITISPTLFDRFKVPKQKVKGQRALSVDVIRRFISCDTFTKREELTKDCCILSLCLMGMNSVDLYNADTYHNGKLIYERTKTRDRRADRARIEIDVHDFIKPLFKKYRSKDGKHVFCFADKYANPKQFNRAINIGLKDLSSRLGVEKMQFYQFRHSVASIARNELHYAKSDIDEMLNHVGDNRIADIYIKKDYSVINMINRKVVEFIFGETEKGEF